MTTQQPANPPAPDTGGQSQTATTTTQTTETKAPDPWSPAALDGEDKGWFENKKYADIKTLVNTTRGLEKMLGAPKDRVLRLPEKPDDPAWGEVYTKLGRPETADKYDFGLPDEVKGAPVVKAMTEIFHKQGLSQAQAKALFDGFQQTRDAQQTGVKEAFAAKSETEWAELETEYGAAFEGRVALAKQAAKAYGVGPEQLDALERAWGTKAMMKFFINIGEAQGEAPVVGTTGQTNKFGQMTPAGAQTKIAELLGDPVFLARYQNENQTVRDAAIAEMERYQKMAAGVAA